MEDIFLRLYTLMGMCVDWATTIINETGGLKYVICGFTAYSIVRFIINPALKRGLPGSGASDTVTKPRQDGYTITGYYSLENKTAGLIEDKHR